MCDVRSSLPPSPPSFSWDTLPIFMHSANQTGPFNDSVAKFLSSFPLVTIEKSQSDKDNTFCTYPCEEDKIINALTQIRNYNESVRGIFYLNSVLNFPQYRLSQIFAQNESLLLHDKYNKLAFMGNCHPNGPNQTIFDLSQEIAQNLWLNTIEYAMQNESVYGIFIDKAHYINFTECSNNGIPLTPQKNDEWQNGHILMIQNAQKLVNKYKAKTGIIITDNGDIDGVNGRMFADFSLNDKIGTNDGNDLNALIKENGIRISEVHKDNCYIFNEEYNQSLSAYLIGAYQYSYYSCSNGWSIQNGWLDVSPDYIKDLGKPLFNATFNKSTNVYFRQFAKGVSVWLDKEWKYPCIQWADQSITGNPDSCSMYTLP